MARLVVAAPMLGVDSASLASMNLRRCSPVSANSPCSVCSPLWNGRDLFNK